MSVQLRGTRLWLLGKFEKELFLIEGKKGGCLSSITSETFVDFFSVDVHGLHKMT